MARNNFEKSAEFTVQGSDRVEIRLPFRPLWVMAEFIDEDSSLTFSSCNPIGEDLVQADVARFGSGDHGIVISWKVNGPRRIRWLAKSSF